MEMCIRDRAIRRRGVPTWGVFPNKALQGGGPLIDIGTHSLDLTLWMMNNYEPKSVMGASFEKLGRLLKPGEQGNGFSTWDNEDYQVEAVSYTHLWLSFIFVDVFTDIPDNLAICI